MRKIVSVILAASLVLINPYSIVQKVSAASQQNVTVKTVEFSKSVTVPTKSVLVTLDANGGNIDNSRVTVPLTFGGYRNGKGELCYDSSGNQIIETGEGERLNPVWSCSVELPAPTREGYFFNGWSVSNEAFSGSSVYTGVTDSTLYATWVESAGKVIYNATQNGGVYSTKDSANLAAGEQIDASPRAEKVGWTFVGWNTDPNAKDAETTITMGSSTQILYAVFSKDVTYTFTDKGGQQTTRIILYNNEQSKDIVTPSVSDYPGWSAKGWSEGTSATSSIVSKTISVGTSNKTLYAIYEKTVSAKFTSGALGNSIAQVDGSVTVNASNLTNEQGFLTTAPKEASTIEGMTLKGWTSKDDSTIADIGIGDEIIITDDCEFQAVYGKPVTLTYDTGGGTDIPTETKDILYNCEKESYPSFTLPVPTRLGHTFHGWFLNGTAVTDTISIRTDSTVKASWGSHKYIIKFDGNESTDGVMDDVDTQCGESFNLPANKFVQERRITLDVNGGILNTNSVLVQSNFLGWATAANRGVVYKDRELVSDLVETENGNITLYAKWSPKTVSLPVPYWPGYVFAGWYNGQDFVGWSCTPTQDISLQAHWVENGLAATIITGTGNNLVIAAEYGKNLPTIDKFEKNYTVTFNYGGIQENAEEIVKYKFCGIFDQPNGKGTKYYDANYSPCRIWNKSSSNATLYAYWEQTSITLPTVEVPGYSISGWYLNGTKVTGKFTPTYDCTLYLNDVKATYNVTLDTRGGRLLSNLTSYTFGEGAVLPRATKRGYAFYGWIEEGTPESATSTDSDGVQAVLTISKDSVGDKSYYAKWVRSVSELEGLTDKDNLIVFDVPEGVEEIPNEFFIDCFKLERVTLPEGLVSIGEYAFDGCEKLREFTLPSTLKSVGKGAFSGTAVEILIVDGDVFDPAWVKDCDSLQTIIINNPNCYVEDSKLSTAVTVKGYTRSTAYQYAATHNCNFESIGDSWQVTFDCGFGNYRMVYVLSNERMPETADVLVWFSNKQNVAFDGYVLKTDTPVVAAGTLFYDNTGSLLWNGRCNFGKDITLTASWVTSKKKKPAVSTTVVKTFTKNNISYKVNGTKVKVTGGAGENIKIPTKVSKNGKTYKVTEVKKGAFRGNLKIKRVTFGENVKIVGQNAFKNCKNLSKITVKRKKITVGKGAVKGTSDTLKVKGTRSAVTAFVKKGNKNIK